MNIQPIRQAPATDLARASASPGTADVPLEKLAGNSALTEKQKIAEASRQFEATLLRQILTEARRPVFHSKFTEKSAATGIYDDLVTNQLADGISRSGEFGLARSLMKQLEKMPDEANP